MQRTEAAELIRRQVLDRLSMAEDLSDEALLEVIDAQLRAAPETGGLPVSDKIWIRKQVFNGLRRLDVLQELLEDETVTEIMVNGCDRIFYERGGRLYPWEQRFTDAERLENVIQQIVGRVDRSVNMADPIVDARLEDGSRVNAVMRPVAINGPILTIRKFPSRPIDMEELIRLGSLTREAAEFLQQAVRDGLNLFISGGTGSGKTTFLNALSGAIPSDARVVTIEDAAELQLPLMNLVRLEARSGNQYGTREITIRDLIRTALRMRPDRLIVGEVRGEETLDMLQAMNTGHAGSMSTGHANSPEDMLSRLEVMVTYAGRDLALPLIREQIAAALDLMVHLGRSREGTRRVLSVEEVCGLRDGQILLRTLYRYENGKGLIRIGDYQGKRDRHLREPDHVPG